MFITCQGCHSSMSEEHDILLVCECCGEVFCEDCVEMNDDYFYECSSCAEKVSLDFQC